MLSPPPRPDWRALLLSGALLASLGGLAVGVSGLAAALVALLASPAALAPPFPPPLTPSSCARWLAGDPHATSCAAAALSDWEADTVMYRIFLGLLALALFLALRYLRSHSLSSWPTLSPSTLARVTLISFLVAGVLLTSLALTSLAAPAYWLTAGLTSLAAAALALRLLHSPS